MNLKYLMMAVVKDEWSFRLTLIRHGETNQNRNKVIQGQVDTILNETGKEQVELVANRFKYEHLTRMYSSDLERALKTAEGICLKNRNLKGMKICIDPLLRERNYGEAEGRSRIELKKILHSGILPQGAESDSQVQKRVMDFFKILLRDVRHLRKTYHSKADVGDSSQLPSEAESMDLKEPIASNDCNSKDKVDQKVETSCSALDKCHLSKVDPQMEKASAVNMYPTSISHPSNVDASGGGTVLSKSPVLLKDLRCDSDDSTECSTNPNRPIHIIIVSHGGVIRHFISYFSKYFPSRFPVHKRNIFRQICPNTSVTDFAVLLEGRKVTFVDCLQLYDSTHLV